MLGQHLLGLEHAGMVELALGHHALAFTEQVRQFAAEAGGHGAGLVGDGEADFAIGGLDHAAGLHQTADAHGLARGHMLGARFARTIEEHDGAAAGVEAQADRGGQDGRGHGQDQQPAAGLPRFGQNGHRL